MRCVRGTVRECILSAPCAAPLLEFESRCWFLAHTPKVEMAWRAQLFRRAPPDLPLLCWVGGKGARGGRRTRGGSDAKGEHAGARSESARAGGARQGALSHRKALARDGEWMRGGEIRRRQVALSSALPSVLRPPRAATARSALWSPCSQPPPTLSAQRRPPCRWSRASSRSPRRPALTQA